MSQLSLSCFHKHNSAIEVPSVQRCAVFILEVLLLSRNIPDAERYCFSDKLKLINLKMH